MVTCMVTRPVTKGVTIGLHFARPIARSLAGLCLSDLRLSAAEIIDRAAQPRLRVRTAMSGPPYQAQKWSVASYNSAMCVHRLLQTLHASVLHDPRVIGSTDLKSTYCVYAHVHEIIKAESK